MTSLSQLFELLLLLLALGADVRHGYAPYYSPGVMERVSRVRHLPLVDCMISSPLDATGTELVVIGLNTQDVERCRVTDVSHPRDRARHLRTLRVAELSYATAQRICGKKALRDRPEACPVIIIKLPKEIDNAARHHQLDDALDRILAAPDCTAQTRYDERRADARDNTRDDGRALFLWARARWRTNVAAGGVDCDAARRSSDGSADHLPAAQKDDTHQNIGADAAQALARLLREQLDVASDNH